LNNKEYEQQFVYFFELVLSQSEVDYREVKNEKSQYETETKDRPEIEHLVDKDRAECNYKEKTEYGQEM
jgi:hypothetical protein